MFDLEIVKEGNYYRLDPKNTFEVIGDGNCLLYALSQTQNMGKRDLLELRGNLSNKLAELCDNYSTLSKIDMPDWYKLLITDDNDFKIHVDSWDHKSLREKKNKIDRWIGQYSWFQNFYDEFRGRSRIPNDNYDSCINQIKKFTSKPKGPEVFVTMMELKTNNSYIVFGSIAPFLSAYFGRQIIVLSKKCDFPLTCSCTAIFGDKVDNTVPLVLIYINDDHYNYWKKE